MARIVGRVFTAQDDAVSKKPKTKKEIIAVLEAAGIEFSPEATVAELKELLPQ